VPAIAQAAASGRVWTLARMSRWAQATPAGEGGDVD